MIEMVKNKYMVLFVVMMLLITYVNSIGIEKLNNDRVEQADIVMNK